MTIQEELELIRKRNDGLLRPEDVVGFAQNENTSLHKQFTWDDNVAAHQYRLWQARQIIRVNVTIVDIGQKEPIKVRTYVSLTSDRCGKGYRATADVFTNEDHRMQLMMDAQKELQSFKEKYRSLSMLEKHLDMAEAALREEIAQHQKKKATIRAKGFIPVPVMA